MRLRRLRARRGPSAAPPPLRARRPRGFGLERRLDDREAGLGRVGERQGDRAVVVEPDHTRHRDQRRIEAAGARGDQDVAAPERIAADLERADLDRAVAAALRDAGVPSRSSRTGTLLAPSVTSSTRDAQRPVSSTRPIRPSGARTGMPTRTPSPVPADRIAKRRGLFEATSRRCARRRPPRGCARAAAARPSAGGFPGAIALASISRLQHRLRARA